MPLILPEDGTIADSQTGILYVVATPIGNLDDITLRALKILETSDFIIAEDTRHTGKLLSHYNIKKRLISCHEYNEAARVSEILGRIRKGANGAIVTDAGTPTVSDPGFLIVKKAIETGIDVRPVPGVSAAITALSVSGFPTDAFVFIGFPSKKKGKRDAQLKTFSTEKRTLIFYESPRRILTFIDELMEHFGDRGAVIGREMTKMHEEFIRGTLSSIYQSLKDRPAVKGEFTLVLKGYEDDQTVSENILLTEIDRGLKESSAKPSSLAKKIAKTTGLPRNRVYDEIVKRIKKDHVVY
ncbi:MAG: 16S rRNA (cytidine(1402)-2'-O)-methyltransferase [Proteobacteria bacterium]|nr:16S rRNA (cytidine(1402)-2'-O)-methyltransferase [Pseudomonadota bacterium]